MFTGIIERMGELVKVEKEQNNIHFHIRSVLAQELKIDQSLAHDGGMFDSGGYSRRCVHCDGSA